MRYLILHRDENFIRGGWRTKETEAEIPEGAVRKTLEDRQIREHEFIVYQVEEGIHRDEFDTGGTFDDLYEDAQ